jgi:hypothetical protein
VLNSVLSVRQLKAGMYKEISKLERINRATTYKQEENKELTENYKEDYLQDVAFNTIFSEVCKNQLQIIEDKEKELK